MPLTGRTSQILTQALADSEAGNEITSLLNGSAGELPQDLGATASPAFAGLSLTGDATVGGNVKVAFGKALEVGGKAVVGAQQSVVSGVTITVTTGSLPVASGAVTIAASATPTVVELLALAVDLKAQVDAMNAVLKAHGLTASA